MAATGVRFAFGHDVLVDTAIVPASGPSGTPDARGPGRDVAQCGPVLEARPVVVTGCWALLGGCHGALVLWRGACSGLGPGEPAG